MTERATRVEVPATTKAGEATVSVHADGSVHSENGKLLGYVSKGSYRYSPKAAGHNRVAQYHKGVGEWEAVTVEDAARPSYERSAYRGGSYPSHYRKNTRLAALAFLVAADAGVEASDARYFTWERK